MVFLCAEVRLFGLLLGRDVSVSSECASLWGGRRRDWLTWEGMVLAVGWVEV